jgi:AcrR family transcriptional regulator
MVRGRPPSARVDAAIRQATLALLEEAGYLSMSVEQVARRAGVGKAAIYRRWRSKAELVFAHLMHDLELQPPDDGGSLRADLTVLAQHLADRLSDPVAGRAMRGLVADVHEDPVLTKRFTTTFIARERECLAVVLDRAVARGELAERPDLAWAHALLAGPVFALLLLFGDEPPPGMGERVAAGVVAALGIT